MSSERQVLVARLGDREIAFDAADVREILQMVEPTPVPGWPALAVGVFVLRGDPVPIVDVAPTVGRAPLEISPDQFLVVVDGGGRPWGVLVDAVADIVPAPIRGIEELAPEDVIDPAVLCQGVVERSGVVVPVFAPEGLLRTFRKVAQTLADGVDLVEGGR